MSYTRKILKILKENEDKSYTVKEIANITNLDENSARVYVNRLRKANEIMMTGKIGNAKLYSVIEHQKQSNIKISMGIHNLNSKLNALTDRIDQLNNKHENLKFLFMEYIKLFEGVLGTENNSERLLESLKNLDIDAIREIKNTIK